jgi:ATP-binding cassette subfamily C (CFTR/MRP) protein 1
MLNDRASLISLHSGFKLFKAALSGVLFSPTHFFDTTPMGRIVSRLSKDQDTIDQELSVRAPLCAGKDTNG